MDFTQQLIQELELLYSYEDGDCNLNRVRQLLQLGADPNISWEGSGWLSISENRLDVVKILVEAGVDVNSNEILGGDITNQEIFDYLAPLTEPWLRRCATLDLPNGIRRQAESENWKEDFLTTRSKIFLEKVETLLLEEVDPNTFGDNGCTLLWTAAYHGYLEAVQTLIEFGVDVNIPNQTDGWSPLTILVATHAPWLEGFSTAKWGEEIKQRSAKIRCETASVLIEAGADVNARTNERLTPLMMATNIDPSLDMVKILLAAGADPNVRNSEGQNVLCRYLAYQAERAQDWTIEEENIESYMNEQVEIVRLLLEAGANVNGKTLSGRNTLLYAQHAKETLFYYGEKNLLVYGTKMESLTLAYRKEANRYQQIIQLLLNAGATEE